MDLYGCEVRRAIFAALSHEVSSGSEWLEEWMMESDESKESESGESTPVWAEELSAVVLSSLFAACI
jgi:siderophore synthetase component